MQSKLKERLAVTNNIDSSEASASAKILLSLKWGAKDAAKELSQGSFFHHYYLTKDDTRLAAPLLLGILIYNPQRKTSSNRGNIANGSSALDEVINNPQEYSDDLVAEVADVAAQLDVVYYLVPV